MPPTTRAAPFSPSRPISHPSEPTHPPEAASDARSPERRYPHEGKKATLMRVRGTTLTRVRMLPS